MRKCLNKILIAEVTELFIDSLTKELIHWLENIK